MQKRILITSLHFWPEPFRINDIAQEWVERGHNVTVLTGYPNYPEGSLYENFKRSVFKKSSHNGFRILRVPILMRGKGKISLILNYISFVITGSIWAVCSREKPDRVFIFATSPIFQAIPAIIFAKLRKIPALIYVQDLWPENVEAVFKIKSPLVIKPIESIARWVYHNAEKILVPSPRFFDAIKRFGIESSKIIFWPQHAEFISKEPTNPTQSFFSIIYAGNIGLAQGLDTLVEAIEILSTQKISAGDIQVSILGDGRYKKDLEHKIHNKKLSMYFRFLNRVSTQEVPSILSQHSVSYLSLQNSPIFNMTIPAKLQTYLGAGIPILASANGEVPRILDESHSGLHAPSGNANALAKQISLFMEMSHKDIHQMGLRGLKYCRDHFDKKNLFDQMDEYLN